MHIKIPSLGYLLARVIFRQRHFTNHSLIHGHKNTRRPSQPRKLAEKSHITQTQNTAVPYRPRTVLEALIHNYTIIIMQGLRAGRGSGWPPRSNALEQRKRKYRHDHPPAAATAKPVLFPSSYATPRLASSSAARPPRSSTFRLTQKQGPRKPKELLWPPLQTQFSLAAQEKARDSWSQLPPRTHPTPLPIRPSVPPDSTSRQSFLFILLPAATRSLSIRRA